VKILVVWRDLTMVTDCVDAVFSTNAVNKAPPEPDEDGHVLFFRR
jgi:hypothetical protein